jgi:ElaB/YqjD/DUF883 family membrane-anchored ribosome-binding protein
MSSDTKTSGTSSAPTSSSAAGKPRVDVGLSRAEAAKRSNPKDKDYDRALDPTVEDKALSADEYLRRQGERAKRAIVGAATNIKDATTSAVTSGRSSAGSAASAYNPIHFVEQRPWTAVAVSAGVGFLGTMWWHPGRYGKVRRRLAALEKRFKQHEKEVVEVKAVGGDNNAGKKTAAAGLGAVLMQQVMAAARPMVMDKLAPLMAGLTGGQPADPADGDGHAGGGYGREPAPESMVDRLNPTV